MQRLAFFLVCLAACILLVAGYFREVTALTQDLGRHILTGNIILSTHTIPSTNLFSYTNPHFPFINHHWLPEVIFALLFSPTGFLGLIILTVILIFSTFALLFAYLYKKVHPLALFLAFLLLFHILLERTDIRPELFSFFFLALFISFLYHFKHTSSKLIFLLPIVSLLWVNTHIYFPLGIGVTGLFFLDHLISHRKQIANQKTYILGLVLVLCLLMTLFNPHGISGALYPFTVFSNYGYTIEENQTPFFLNTLGIYKTSFTYLLVSILLQFTTLLIAIKKTQPIDWFLTIAFTIFSLLAVRNFPLFAIATLIPFSLSLSYVITLLSKKVLLPSYLTLVGIGILCVWFITILIQTVQTEKTGYSVPQGATKAVDFYQSNSLTGPLFNNFDIGSYLEYRLYPKEKVFIDGRPEAYPEGFIQDVYIAMQQDPKIFAKYEKKYQFNTIIFSHTDMTPWAQTFLSTIVNNNTWRPVYLDPMILILVKDDSKNEAVLSRFAQPINTLPVHHLDTSNINHLLMLSNFFAKIGLFEREQPLLQQVLKRDPHNCYALSRILQNTESSPLTLLYSKRFESYCQ